MSDSILGLIGNTPLLKVRGLDAGRCELFLKLENQNPGGSIKDRIGLSMIAAAEQEGKVRPGSTLIEATAGNTGLGLALVAARELLRREGVLAGSSTGTLLAAALRYCRESRERKRVATFVCDTGNKYLSKMYDDYWMADQGFLKRPVFNDLRDLVGRPHSDRSVCSVKPEDTLKTAFARMRLYEYSQLPVLEGDKVVGILDESDILVAVHEDAANYRKPVRGTMTRELVTVEPSTPIHELAAILNKGLAGLLYCEGRFYGLITRVDLLNHLRRKFG